MHNGESASGNVRLSQRELRSTKRLRWLKNDWRLYSLLLLPLLYYFLFHYMPMYGTLIAFKKYSPRKGIWGSDWIGVTNFVKFLSDPYFYKLVRNTLLINLYSLIFAFPASILFALLLNEIQARRYKKLVQTVSYLPHFISTVVVCGLITNFLRTNDGIINQFLALLGFERVSFLSKAEYFRTIYVVSGIWQHLGWDAIIYIAALTGINEELYEAARIEGANRLQRAIYVTLPGIAPTITIMLIMRVGNLMNLGYEKILLLYSGVTYETADVISTYVYRRGLLDANFGYGTAVGLFQSVVAMILIIGANSLGKRISDTSLW
ncbi:ABC transporter permease subunit [Eubacteriales bacterium OttesenSCG-928-A19]|nr:ABC transporter permease subunit [Eubacteriales bacterium OttesenSCG-928-A19]